MPTTAAKLNLIEIEDIVGDVAHLSLVGQDDPVIMIKTSATLWLDKAGATVLGTALLNMAERVT